MTVANSARSLPGRPCACAPDTLTTEFWKQNGFQMMRCNGCGLFWLNSRPVESSARGLYSRDYFQTFYVQHRRERLHFFDTWLATLERWHKPGGRLLDIGCGIGLFLEAARSKGWDVTGVEPSVGAADLRDPSLPVWCGTLESAAIPRSSLDVITFWDVLAHLPDPRATLVRARGLLRDGGLVLIKTPNRSPSYMALARPLTPLRATRAWLHAPAQVFHFTPASLRAMVSAAGFRVVHWVYAAEPVSTSLTAAIRDPKILASNCLRLALRLMGNAESFVLIGQVGAT